MVCCGVTVTVTGILKLPADSLIVSLAVLNCTVAVGTVRGSNSSSHGRQLADVAFGLVEAN